MENKRLSHIDSAFWVREDSEERREKRLLRSGRLGNVEQYGVYQIIYQISNNNIIYGVINDIIIKFHTLLDCRSFSLQIQGIIQSSLSSLLSTHEPTSPASFR